MDSCSQSDRLHRALPGLIELEFHLRGSLFLSTRRAFATTHLITVDATWFRTFPQTDGQQCTDDDGQTLFGSAHSAIRTLTIQSTLPFAHKSRNFFLSAALCVSALSAFNFDVNHLNAEFAEAQRAAEYVFSPYR